MQQIDWQHIIHLFKDLPEGIQAPDLALQRKRYSSLTDEEWHILLQQVEGRQRMKNKLPELGKHEGWIFPPRLNMEQCSSEATARYKMHVVEQLGIDHLTDLTGGYGIDFYYMSQAAQEAHYVEQNAELQNLVTHNFKLLHRTTCQLHNAKAEDYIRQSTTSDMHGRRLIYMDPARRSNSGSKVFRIEDCEPNVLNLLPILHQKADVIMLKLSPMLDQTAAIQALGGQWQTHIVAVGGEVKEVLLVQDLQKQLSEETIVTDVQQNIQFCFTPKEENQVCIEQYVHTVEVGDYLYEPHAAILKAGAYKLISSRYSIRKLAPNTHLYACKDFRENFPGRIFRVLEADCNTRMLKGRKANVLCRNFNMAAEELKKRLSIKDGGEMFVIGTSLATPKGTKPTLLWTERCK